MSPLRATVLPDLASLLPSFTFRLQRLETENMSQLAEVQYVSDAEGNPIGVIVPIEVWREIESERETAYLLKSDAMRQRLRDAKMRGEPKALLLASQVYDGLSDIEIDDIERIAIGEETMHP